MTVFVDAGDVRLAAETWGDPKAPAVLMLHGYPDCRRVWRYVAARLATERYVVAYDVRGAGESSRPSRTQDYRMDRLCDDLTAVLDRLLPDRQVHLVGHDWGSIQAWEAVWRLQDSGRVAAFTSMSGPCLDHVGHWFRERLAQPDAWPAAARQLLKSWYIFSFQAPVLAPLAWRAGIGRAWPRMLARVEGVPEERRQPSASLALDGRYGIGLYRANMLPRLTRPADRFVRTPVQLLVAERDAFVDPVLFDATARWTERLSRVDLDGGHWLPLSRPEAVADAILAFRA